MCFNEQILSAFADGELSEEQGESIESHLLECGACRSRVEFYGILTEKVKFSGVDTSTFIQESIWTRLGHATSTSSRLGFWHRRFFLAPSVMVSLSFMFIAVIGIGFFLLFQDNGSNAFYVSNADEPFPSENFPVNIPVDSIEQILAYFDIYDEPMEVVIQLPDSSSFTIQGEPLFLLKANYTVGY
ncbi:MAG: zf-HC2 domain-containing protein [Spirochaetales bacterium]|nr:zf-HC2 domain-containing protein [Spirochaetales bacterium]